MEIVRDEKFRAALLAQIAKREFDEERTGVHQSDLVYCLNKQALRRLKPREGEDHEILLYSLGWSTQRWLTGTFDPEESHEVDGIIVTPDAVLIDELAPWELKATFQSSNKPMEENIHWIRQVMAECWVTQSRVGYLTRLEIMGDWKWVFGKKDEKAQSKRPTLSAFRLEFTQEELEKNWNWLKQRRELFLGVLETGELLPKALALAGGMGWECEYCPYKGDCETKTD